MNAPEKPGGSEVQDNVYAAVYRALMAGMVASSILFAVGLARGMMLHTYFPLTPEWIQQHYHWHAAMEGLKSFDPTVLMMLATILLILTPVVRVVVSIYAFAVDRDGKYVLITTIVFAIMVLTFLLSHFFGLQ